MIDTVMLILGYIVTGIVGAFLLYFILAGLWLYLSRNLVLWYVVNKAEKRFPDEAVKPEFKRKPFWKVRLFLLIFSEWNTDGDSTRSSGKWTIWYNDLRVRWRVEGG